MKALTFTKEFTDKTEFNKLLSISSRSRIEAAQNCVMK